jgi:hypothetical protein
MEITLSVAQSVGVGVGETTAVTGKVAMDNGEIGVTVSVALGAGAEVGEDTAVVGVGETTAVCATGLAPSVVDGPLVIWAMELLEELFPQEQLTNSNPLTQVMADKTSQE